MIMPTGLASYSRRKRPGLDVSLVSRGYRNTPPRIRMRCASATMLAIQRMLKSLAAGARFASQAFVHIAFDRGFPEAGVGGIDGELLRVHGNLNIGVGQHELAQIGVQRKA
jgi:hypothetical protein